MAKDADKILDAIDLDELMKNPEVYLVELGKAFMDKHSKDIEKGFNEGKDFANEVLKKS
tara:strand:- start:154 stop:330 length:177 start_codon:yes stop_codon:yes gene_type:complete